MADILSQILQGGLMNYSAPNALNQGLMSGDPSMQLGMRLLANSNTPGNFGGILGRSLAETQQLGQANAANQIDLLTKATQLGLTQSKMNALANWTNPGSAPADIGSAPPADPIPQGQPPQGQFSQGQPSQVGGAPPMQGTQPAPQASAATDFDVPRADVYSLPISGHSPDQYKSLQMFGFNKDAGEAEESARKLQLETAQALTKPKIGLLDQVVKSDQAAQMVQSSPPLMKLWQQSAPQYGINPAAGFNDANVRRVMSARRNQLATWAQLPTEAPPTQMQDVTGPYGYRGQKDPITGKETQVQGRDLPTYALKDKWNPDTNRNEAIPVQTGGWGMGGTNPVSGATTSRGGVPSQGAQKSVGAAASPKGVDLGYKAPDDANLKAAMFASEMRAGLSTMDGMERKGFILSPKARAIAINMATEEGSGGLVGHLLGEGASQYLSQQVAAKGLTPEEQTYLSAMMPMLQAAGHDQSGARLTTAQIRQNVESLLPMGKSSENLDQVRKNRDGFYMGLLGQAGSASQLPQYRNTLGTDLSSAQQRAQQPQVTARRVIGGKSYYQQNGKWYAD